MTLFDEERVDRRHLVEYIILFYCCFFVIFVTFIDFFIKTSKECLDVGLYLANKFFKSKSIQFIRKSEIK